MPSYPLDFPSVSTISRLATQPYPAYPHGIFVSRQVFELSMSAWTPVAIGALYLLMSKTANSRLKRRIAQNKRGEAPPPKDYIKGSKILSNLVLAHNAALAVFSAWAFWGTFTRVVPYFWHGATQGGLQGLGNAYCTVPTHDPTGLGGILWWFYISKYYEIFDSIILILKGKKVSNLQSYHHAGAIAAMWSGVRYSASAIFIFSMFNGAIHTLMYSYYTLSTLRLPFASALKKSMTTAQITQLVVGCFIASLSLFVSYSPTAYPSGALPSIGDLEGILSSRSYQNLREVLKSETVTAALGDTNSFTAQMRNYLLTLGTVSASGSSNTSTHASHSSSTAVPATTPSILLRDGLLYAVVYLLPLILLFVRFYLRSYRVKQVGEHEGGPAIKANLKTKKSQ
ncbi:hypothetical protein K437DRAFT_253668 [Tilletiaria anomala UBC 951]|uniref:Elongation of fatty acids protein n=1 Tax=Tilletiaria anomala (strain ATCC 24038 / CBS 436.72 / UBC 951) TaxID=1037660 RepID=A0A066WGT5_TILAU|nr:uncharacterized protein K437DRAFT_253668 [Tilletiaria anomala UBC 951]KDN53016.1 hypothetical protein K437DRAFT_253668 [Tilletiaria anomala UBC 951]